MLPGAVVFFVFAAAVTVVLTIIGKVPGWVPTLCLTVAMMIQVLGR